MKKRLYPFGLGKFIMNIKLDELPNDIKESIIERTSKRNDEGKITEDTVEIVFVGEIIPKSDK